MTEHKHGISGRKEVKNKLYVVLRGEFAMHTTSDMRGVGKLKILAPTVDLHEYWAGPWKNLTPISQWSVLTLEGVEPGTKRVEDCGMFIKLGLKQPAPALGKPEFTVFLPLPEKIYPGIMDDSATVAISVNNGPWVSGPPSVPAWPAIVAILQYELDLTHTPQLVSDQDQPFPCGDGTMANYKVIHIVASGSTEESEKPKHAKDAFRSAAALLGVDASVDWKEAKDGGPSYPLAVKPPHGLTDEEANHPWWAVIKNRKPGNKAAPGSEDEEGSGNCGPVVP